MRDVKMANIEITYIQFVLIKLLLSPMECMEWLSSRYKLSKACNEILKCLVHVLLVLDFFRSPNSFLTKKYPRLMFSIYKRNM